MAALNARTPRSADPRRGERGHVLLTTAVMGLLAMALWTTAWRATHDAIRAERFVVRRGVRTHSVGQALARGVILLQSGRPPTDPYSCRITLTDGADSWTCAVLYESQGGPDDWRVDARFATDDEQANLPVMPATFGS